MKLSVADKVRFLMEATKGPSDCYALRSFDPNRDQPRYWRPVYAPLNDETVIRHLRGDIEIGAYALVPGMSQYEFPKCWWIAADFDGKKQGVDWQRDVQRFLSFICESGANILVNRSRSGQGVHVRVLFREAVPGWMARRWMNAWLEEASVVSEIDDAIPSSFDRIIPMQDTLRTDLTRDGHRRPGNLVGTPMHKGLAEAHGGTLPISTEAALEGEFDADGKHWEHLVRALDRREWDEEQLLAALLDAPGSDDGKPPAGGAYPNRALTVLQGDCASSSLLVTQRLCSFFQYIQSGGQLSYGLWVAMASELHHFGEAGRKAFHELSALDPRYKEHDTEQKWIQTSDMHPIRCDRLVADGFRCPHLGTKRCNGAMTPAYLPEHAGYEPL